MIRIEISAAAYAVLCAGVPEHRLLEAQGSPSGGFYLWLDKSHGKSPQGRPWARGELFRRHSPFRQRGRMTDELNLTQQIAIARAVRAGVAPQRVADYFRVTLAQVNAIAALDQQYCKEEKEFAAWIAANSRRPPK